MNTLPKSSYKSTFLKEKDIHNQQSFNNKKKSSRKNIIIIEKKMKQIN